jgi:hypothetical protein
MNRLLKDKSPAEIKRLERTVRRVLATPRSAQPRNYIPKLSPERLETEQWRRREVRRQKRFKDNSQE